jgi:hypothetical protein
VYKKIHFRERRWKFSALSCKTWQKQERNEKENMGKASIYGDFEIFDFSIFENFVFSETGVCTP